jgi:CMP-N,N'-diacetyllegionaminic acid synthase
VIGASRVLAVIPARGGSKGVPGKNRKVLGQLPLIGWTLEAAMGCAALDHVVVTSDDEALLEIAARLAPQAQRVLRPAELARDTTPMLPVVQHAIEQAGSGYEVIVLLQPTSPLRTSAQIEEALALMAQRGAPSVVSVVQPGKSPYWMYRRVAGELLEPLLPLEAATRRQDLPPAYALNGAIYGVQIEQLRQEEAFVTARTVGYEMDAFSSLDIDTEWDWVMAEAAVAWRGR